MRNQLSTNRNHPKTSMIMKRDGLPSALENSCWPFSVLRYLAQFNSFQINNQFCIESLLCLSLFRQWWSNRAHSFTSRNVISLRDHVINGNYFSKQRVHLDVYCLYRSSRNERHVSWIVHLGKEAAAVVCCCFHPASSVSLLLISRTTFVLSEMVLEQRFAIPRGDNGQAQRSESTERCFHADPISVVNQHAGHCSFLLHLDGSSYSCSLFDMITNQKQNQSKFARYNHSRPQTHINLSLTRTRGVSDRWTQVKLGSYFEHQNVLVVEIMASFLVWRWVKTISPLFLLMAEIVLGS